MYACMHLYLMNSITTTADIKLVSEWLYKKESLLLVLNIELTLTCMREYFFFKISNISVSFLSILIHKSCTNTIMNPKNQIAMCILTILACLSPRDSNCEVE